MLFTFSDLIINLIFAFAVGLFSVVLFVPRLTKSAREKGSIDHPGGHKTHKRDIPTLGGFAIFLGFLLAMLVVFPFCKQSFHPGSIYTLFGILIGAGLIFLMTI